MQLKDINRDEIIEHRKRLEKHKKAIESDIKDVTVQEKTIGTIKKKTMKKKVIDKKAKKEKQKAFAEKAMENARKDKIDIDDSLDSSLVFEEEPEEPKIVITKEERAERFRRLNAMVQDMMKKRDESTTVS